VQTDPDSMTVDTLGNLELDSQADKDSSNSTAAL
jgi:hypothetical protein